jgi:hypothetical protein
MFQAVNGPAIANVHKADYNTMNNTIQSARLGCIEKPSTGVGVKSAINKT